MTSRSDRARTRYFKVLPPRPDGAGSPGSRLEADIGTFHHSPLRKVPHVEAPEGNDGARRGIEQAGARTDERAWPPRFLLENSPFGLSRARRTISIGGAGHVERLLARTSRTGGRDVEPVPAEGGERARGEGDQA